MFCNYKSCIWNHAEICSRPLMIASHLPCPNNGRHSVSISIAHVVMIRQVSNNLHRTPVIFGTLQETTKLGVWSKDTNSFFEAESTLKYA